MPVSCITASAVATAAAIVQVLAPNHPSISRPITAGIENDAWAISNANTAPPIENGSAASGRAIDDLENGATRVSLQITAATV